jgi:hypothetical protein
VATLLYLFRGGEIACRGAADVNGDGAVQISDPVSLLDTLFRAAAALEERVVECR